MEIVLLKKWSYLILVFITHTSLYRGGDFDSGLIKVMGIIQVQSLSAQSIPSNEPQHCVYCRSIVVALNYCDGTLKLLLN